MIIKIDDILFIGFSTFKEWDTDGPFIFIFSDNLIIFIEINRWLASAISSNKFRAVEYEFREMVVDQSNTFLEYPVISD